MGSHKSSKINIRVTSVKGHINYKVTEPVSVTQMCSVVLFSSSEQRPVVLTSKSRFTFSVSVLDLDLKPYESIPHQYKLDGEIVNYYLKNIQAKEDPVMSNLFKENEDCTLVLHKV